MFKGELSVGAINNHFYQYNYQNYPFDYCSLPFKNSIKTFL